MTVPILLQATNFDPLSESQLSGTSGTCIIRP